VGEMTNVKTKAAHKPYEFQEYQFRDLPLHGKNVSKISNFGGFSTSNPQMWASWVKFGRAWWTNPLPNLTPIGAVVRLCRAKNNIPAVFCR